MFDHHHHDRHGHHDHHRRCRGRRRFARDESGRGHRHGDSDGHSHRAHGGRRSARLFDHGDLRLVVLSLIAEQPRHGYELMKEIEGRVGGSYSPSPGVIYPTLTLLEEMGLATVEESGGKKRYAITEEGREHLATHRGAVEAVQARIEEVRANHGGGPAPQIIRAMENLKLALRLRQRGGPLSEEQLQSIVATLDAAAVAIERS